MMNFFKTLLLVTLFTFTTACCSKKEKVTPEKEAIVQIAKKSEKEMLDQGYIQASIIFYKEKATPCSYLIKLNENMFLEPRKELNNEFKKDKQQIWVKYHPQRRMSRCGNAQPVEIIGIELR